MKHLIKSPLPKVLDQTPSGILWSSTDVTCFALKAISGIGFGKTTYPLGKLPGGADLPPFCG